MCIELRALNANTMLHVFPLSRIADLLDILGRAGYSGSVNLANAYHYVKIAAGSTYKTGFPTNKGFIEYSFILFGLFNALATFQRLMNLAFTNMLNGFVTVYLDDILVYSKTQ